MRIARWRGVGATCLALAGAAGQARAQPVVTLDRGTAYEMSREGNHWVARVYVTPASTAAAPLLAVTLRAVAAGARTDPAMTRLFPPPRRVPTTGPLTAFDVITEDGATVPQGIYDVLVSVGAAASLQEVTLQMTVPAALLVVPPALSVSRVQPLFGGGGEPGLALRLMETGGKSAATVRVVQQGRFSADGTEYTGQLAFDGATIPAGQPGVVAYRLSGELPLGSVRTNLAVSAPELAAPLSVPVEVRTRRSKALLVIFVVGGLVLGFLMRTYLAQQVQFGELKERAIVVLRRLQSAAKTTADRGFEAEIGRAALPLKAAVESERSSVEDLKSATDLAERAAAAAATSLQGRLTLVVDALKEMNPIVQTAWRLPAAVVGPLARAAADVQSIRTLVEAGNSIDAAAQLEATQAAIDPPVIEAARVWKREARTLVHGLEHLVQFLLPTAQARLQAAIQTLSTSSTDTPETWPDATAAARVAVLTALQSAMMTARECLFDAALEVPDSWEANERALAGVELPDAPAWELARAPTERFAAWLKSASSDLTLAAGLRQRADALADIWRPAFLEQTHDAGVVSLVNEARYPQAANELARVLRAEAAKRAEAAGALEDESFEAGTPAASLRAAGRAARRVIGPSPASGTRLSFDAPGDPDDVVGPSSFKVLSPSVRSPVTLEAIEARTWRQLLVARGVRWGLSAVGLAIVGYLLFEAKFTGTSGDLMTAFFWGFTTDIGLDALLAARVAKAPA